MKTLACGELVPGCPAIVSAETEEEICRSRLSTLSRPTASPSTTASRRRSEGRFARMGNPHSAPNVSFRARRRGISWSANHRDS